MNHSLHEKGVMLYEGKGKKVFESSDSGAVIFEFKNDLTAFNALKKGQFAGKGEINCTLSEFFFRILDNAGVKTHWQKRLSPTEARVDKSLMVALEVVVRNKIAGSLEKRLGKKRGGKLSKPILEFYYKRDDLGDPIVTEDHIAELNLANAETISELKNLALKVNKLFLHLLRDVEIDLVDFKMEFGHSGEQKCLVVADEFSPDSMRLWDLKTEESFDKDRFRFDTGDVGDGYREVLSRLKRSNQWEKFVTAF